ncbi:DUF2530 domain-containing protein [Mycobacterium conspicuum]|jgi:hypothetical protein|nr:DUF2530 domain-containing protein [Mycobacterium conspicuum]ORV45169.1 hypothetical protein AWC00_06230 [Mycobacterium conspicuum]
MLVAMSTDREPPRLPPRLLAVWPIIAIGELGWLLATIAAFTMPALQGWRPMVLAGLGTGFVGTSIFLLQLAGARRGARGAQSGLETFLNPN